MKTIFKLRMNLGAIIAVCIAAIVMSCTASYGSGNSNSLTVTEAMAKAKKDGNAVFLVLTGTGDTLHEKAMEMAKSANKLEKKSIVIELNVNDTANNKLVALYGLSNAPIPIILVFSANGILINGFLYSQATPEILVKTIPSHKQDDILLALSNKKSVFIVVTKKSYIDQYDKISRCDSAIAKMNNKAELVKVYMDDIKEKELLDLLKVDYTSAKTAIVVLNSKGVVNATYYELTNSATLVTAATKVASSCCSGSNKTCGPK